MDQVITLPGFSVAVAGGIASGKSTLCLALKAELQKLAISVNYFCYDQFRREILIGQRRESFELLCSSLKREFGAEVFITPTLIHRLRLNEIIFADSAALKQFNDLIDPLIISEMFNASNLESDLTLVEWPCILERGLSGLCKNNVILVHCSVREQLRRLQAGDLSSNEVKQRIRLQGSREQRLELFVGLKKQEDQIRYACISELGANTNLSRDLASQISAKLKLNLEVCR